MHGKHIHFQKSNLFTCGRCSCPADDRRAPGGRALFPVEAAVPRVELDSAQRTTQGHDLPWTPVGPGSKGRHPSPCKEKDPVQEPFPTPKPAGTDGNRPKPNREAFARAFPHLDSPCAKKPFGKTLQQPHRGAPLPGIHPASWRAPQVHGFFRGPSGGMPCLLLCRMASGATR